MNDSNLITSDTRSVLNLLTAQMLPSTLAAMHRDLCESVFTETNAALLQIIDSMGVARCGEEAWGIVLEAA